MRVKTLCRSYRETNVGLQAGAILDVLPHDSVGGASLSPRCTTGGFGGVELQTCYARVPFGLVLFPTGGVACPEIFDG